MNKISKAYIELHLAVFLFGFAAILGDLIRVSAISMVWWRLIMSIGLFMLFKQIYCEVKGMSKKHVYILLGIGAIISVHWVCFYGSVKLANASVALISFSATPFFTALVEPLFRKMPWKRIDFILGVCIVVAMGFIFNTLDLSMYSGMLVGLLAAFLAAVFISLNKKYIEIASPTTMLFIEMIGAFLFLTILLPIVYKTDFSGFVPKGMDWFFLILMVVFCTMLAFVLHLRSLKHISAFTSNFVISLEPVYGIFLAIIILKEHRELNTQFYFGVVFMITLVFLYPFIKVKDKNSKL